jgi:hypothetical protein
VRHSANELHLNGVLAGQAMPTWWVFDVLQARHMAAGDMELSLAMPIFIFLRAVLLLGHWEPALLLSWGALLSYGAMLMAWRAWFER